MQQKLRRSLEDRWLPGHAADVRQQACSLALSIVPAHVLRESVFADAELLLDGVRCVRVSMPRLTWRACWP
jgi:hypothetical protein